ncbi:BglG family transcription antiterminator [Clostridium butyricum]|nr:BglG family transcription antiterminator [Clostridium butyricum]MDI9209511.1 BglG family transcription antiterminator [Clostridium butyricum]
MERHLDRKLYDVLEILLSNKKVFLDTFSEEMEVSTRSIRNYIKQLQQQIDKSILEITKENSGAYSIIIHDNEELNMILNANKVSSKCQLNDPDERVYYLLERLADLDDFIVIDDLVSELYVGRSTLIKDLKKVDNKLKEYGLVLKRKTNMGIKLKGSEMNIRLFMTDYLYETKEEAYKVIINNIELKSEIIKELEETIIIYLQRSNCQITNELINNLFKAILIMISRVKKNKIVTSVPTQYKIMDSTYEYKTAVGLIDIIRKKLKIDINESEAYFISIQLIGRGAPVCHDLLTNINITENIIQLRKEICGRILECTGLNLMEDEQILESLDYHLYYAINRIALNIKYKNPMLKEIKEKYKLPYEVAKIAAVVLEEKHNICVSEDEIGYIALHFGAYIEKSEKNFLKIKKAAIICSTGLGTAKLLNVKLKKLLDENIEFNTFSDMDFTEEIAENYDMVFTTVDLNIKLDIPMVKLNSIFEEDELKKEIESQVMLKKIARNKISTEGRYILKNLINKNLIYYLDKKTFDENLLNMLDKITDRKIVSKDFKGKVIERERKASTMLGGLIALPHAVDVNVKEVVICYGVLDEIKVVNGKEAGLIVLMIIPSDSQNCQNMIVKTYEQIIELANNKNIVRKLIKSKNYEEFKSILGGI